MRFSAAVKGCDPVIRTKKADKNEILFEFRTVFVIEILFLLLHFTSLYKNSIFDTILDNRYQILITQSSYICVLIGN